MAIDDLSSWYQGLKINLGLILIVGHHDDDKTLNTNVPQNPATIHNNVHVLSNMTKLQHTGCKTGNLTNLMSTVSIGVLIFFVLRCISC